MGYILAAVLGGFLLFNSAATPQRAQDMAEKVLRKRFPGAEVAVHIEGKRGRDVTRGKFKLVRVSMSHFGWTGFPLQATANARSRGHAGRLELQLRDFTWNDLKINSADFAFDQVTYDWKALQQEGQMKVTDCGPATARLTVPAASLEALVQKRLKDVEGAQLALQDGQMRVSGRKSAPVLGSVPFVLTARPEARNGNEIWLPSPHVQVADIPLMPALTNGIVGNINPVYVFDRNRKWAYRVVLTSIQANNNLLEITANLHFVPVHGSAVHPDTSVIKALPPPPR